MELLAHNGKDTPFAAAMQREGTYHRIKDPGWLQKLLDSPGVGQNRLRII
jgi:hypothetical protein